MTESDQERVVCELCGADQTIPLMTGKDRLLGVPGEFHVVQCQQCGLVYTNPRPTMEKLRDYYPQHYGVYAPGGGQAVRIGHYHRRIAKRLNRLPAPGKRVLDLGCGDGAFLSEMKQLGWDAVGLEMDESAAERARSVRGLKVFTGTVEQADFQAQSFDLITLSHLLEHVPHPRQTLQAVKRWLKPGGFAFITLPNVESWERRKFGEFWYPWDLPRHLFHFSPATLTRLLKEEAFEVKDVRFLNAMFLPQSMRYQKQGNAPTPELPSSEEPLPAHEGNPLKETLKTFAFRSLLGFASATGRFTQGEVMEVIAQAPA